MTKEFIRTLTRPAADLDLVVDMDKLSLSNKGQTITKTHVVRTTTAAGFLQNTTGAFDSLVDEAAKAGDIIRVFVYGDVASDSTLIDVVDFSILTRDANNNIVVVRGNRLEWETSTDFELPVGGLPNINAVVFEGGDTYLTRGADLTGSADLNEMTLSMWINLTSPTEDSSVIGLFGADNSAVDPLVIRRTSAALQHFMDSTDNSLAINRGASQGYFGSSGGWFHIFESWQRSTNTHNIYVNGSAIPGSPFTWSDDTQAVDNTWTDWYINSTPDAPTSHPFATWGHVWMDDAYYDPATVIGDFIDGDGDPVAINANGTTTNIVTQPLIYLTGPASTFATNAGTGGNFTVTGTGLKDLD